MDLYGSILDLHHQRFGVRRDSTLGRGRAQHVSRGVGLAVGQNVLVDTALSKG